MSGNLGEIVREIAWNRNTRSFGTPCEVLSVDMDAATIECSPIDGTADYTAKLQSNATSGLLFVPKVGSIVIVEQTSVNSGYVTMWGEIEEIVFMGGDNKGLVKVSDLVSSLNALENKVNTIINTFNSHTHAGVTTGAGTSAVSTVLVTGTLQNTTISDLENPKITH